MQDISKGERERKGNRKHKGFVSRFEHTCSTSPPSTHEGFPLCKIPMDLSSVPYTYKPSDSQVPYTRKSTDSPRPHLAPQEFTPELHTTTSTLARLLKEQRTSLW